jgi:hypothetical protein
MADNDATAALFREILGMTSGGTLGGRQPMSIPDEIMDSVTGDAAQETLARNRLLTEMRRQEDTRRGAEFVNLDMLTEMDSGDVDNFLSHARKKIIKRSKPTRTACCAKIGGVLDQILGTAGGEHAELQGVRDRGADDPTGDVDQVAEADLDEGLRASTRKFQALDRAVRQNPGDAEAAAARKEAERAKHADEYSGERRAWEKAPNQDVKDKIQQGRYSLRGTPSTAGRKQMSSADADTDLLNFIAEEFFHFEHDESCQFADPRFDLNPDPLAEHKYISGATKSPGLLRDYYHLKEGESISAEKAKADYARLQEREDALAGNQLKLFERLGHYLALLGSAPTQQEEVTTNMEASKTAKALSGFMESSLNPYAAAKSGGGKGAPDADKMKDRLYTDGLKTRDDNQEYKTELKPAKSGNKTVAGAPGKVSTRDKDAGDPIGEGEDAIEEGSTGYARQIRILKSGKLDPDAEMAHARKAGTKQIQQNDRSNDTPAGKQVRGYIHQSSRGLKTKGQDSDFPGKNEGEWAKVRGEMTKSRLLGQDSHDAPDGQVRRVSNTASALANFMEASGQYAAAREKLALKGKDAGETDLDDCEKQPYGLPTKPAKGERSKADVYDEGGKKPRYEKDADPIGGANEKDAAGSRMKK